MENHNDFKLEIQIPISSLSFMSSQYVLTQSNYICVFTISEVNLTVNDNQVWTSGSMSDQTITITLMNQTRSIGVESFKNITAGIIIERIDTFNTLGMMKGKYS